MDVGCKRLVAVWKVNNRNRILSLVVSSSAQNMQRGTRAPHVIRYENGSGGFSAQLGSDARAKHACSSMPRFSPAIAIIGSIIPSSPSP